ncbi:hypothetical protein [Streptomyces sp. NPDC052225]|uniref:hypothetical protein n=1 Tax=Streptomyces sp. NPDC052225 TaxID=3154949 RepID=UPI003422DA08
MFILLMYGAFLAVPLWGVAVLVKLVSVALPGRRAAWGRDLLRWCAVMAAAAAVLVYVIGLGLVQWAATEAASGANSAPAEPCRHLGSETLGHLAGHEPSYLPLGFDCVLDDGTLVAGSGGYLGFNAVAAAFALTAVLLLIGMGFWDERRARARMKATQEAEFRCADSV